MKLNGFEVPARLEGLMRRADWEGKRTGESWLRAFGYPQGGFVEFCGLDQLQRENANIRSPELASPCGAPNLEKPPGDFDPAQGFLIGFTAWVDDEICVDFRPDTGPRLIYYDGQNNCFATAFQRLEAFCAFFEEHPG